VREQSNSPQLPLVIALRRCLLSLSRKLYVLQSGEQETAHDVYQHAAMLHHQLHDPASGDLPRRHTWHRT
jgi:hypothetical protein